MDISSFTKEELQNIEDLLAISNIISSIYDKLYHLEIENKQDSHEYQKLLKELEKSIIIEKSKYKKANLNFENCKKIFNLLTSSNGLLRIGNTECILFQKYEDKVIRRIMSNLSEKITLDIEFQKEILTDFLNITKEQQEKVLPIYKSFNNSIKMQKAITKDILSIFLSILLEYISSTKFNEYKNELIKLKYYISFITETIEANMLNCNFIPFESTYISSNITANILKIEQTEYNKIIEIEASITALTHITELLEIKDSDYKIKKKNIESIIRQCYIRACLTLMNKDSVYNLNQEFHDLIENNEYLRKHLNDRISENAIIQCFKSQKYDRTKTRILSLQIP